MENKFCYNRQWPLTAAPRKLRGSQFEPLVSESIHFVKVSPEQDAGSLLVLFHGSACNPTSPKWLSQWGSVRVLQLRHKAPSNHSHRIGYSQVTTSTTIWCYTVTVIQNITILKIKQWTWHNDVCQSTRSSAWSGHLRSHGQHKAAFAFLTSQKACFEKQPCHTVR